MSLKLRLREAVMAHLATDPDLAEPFTLAHTCAAIGAEFEREACEEIARTLATHMRGAPAVYHAIRARGGK